jgi:hypothetical protein
MAALPIALAVFSILGSATEALAEDNPGDRGEGPKAAVKILFVGNSYTFARVLPALQYNSANVKDLNAAWNAIDYVGTNSYPVGSGIPPNPCAVKGTKCFEPHPWGGVPGIFKRLTDQAGLNYDVSLSTRNAASLRGHALNSSGHWDLRGNIASQKWDIVVIQGLSDEPLPANKAKNGNFVSYSTNLKRLEQYIHVGTGETTTESMIYGSLANCTRATTANPPGPGFSADSCQITRVIPTNTNASPDTSIYLFETWARPDMVAAHKCTIPDVTTTNGAPIVDPTCANGDNGSVATGQNTIYYTSKPTAAANLKDMTTDFHNVTYERVSSSNGKLLGVVPVGDAFQTAVDTNVVKADNFYKADGTYDDSGLPNLWWLDRTHESVYGAYLAGLVMFGTITGRDPLELGDDDRTLGELGIDAAEALMLQRVAHDTLAAAACAARGQSRHSPEHGGGAEAGQASGDCD